VEELDTVKIELETLHKSALKLHSVIVKNLDTMLA
jgi:hypothetical protein